MHAVVKGGQGPFIYRWDVNGDNAYDYAGLGVFEVGVHYASAGLYKIKLEVEDQQGQFFIAYAQVQVKPSGPAAVPDAMPIIGAAPLIVELDGSASYDLDGYITKWEWDYLSDGIYEYESDTEPTTTTTYQGPGTYNATLRVTDDDGFQDIASVQVVVL
jgi:PKD repeat protein